MATIDINVTRIVEEVTITATPNLTTVNINTNSGSGSTPDATTTVKGKVKLAGDLAGTADAPTVPTLANKANTADLGAVAFSNDYNDLDNKADLQSVTDVGKVTTNEIKANWFEFYDTLIGGYAKISSENNNVQIYDSTGVLNKEIGNGGVEQTYTYDGFRLIKEVGLLTGDRNRTEPDKDGMYAMLDDIPTTATDLDALQRDGSNANSDINIGNYNFTAKSVIINTTGGAKYIELKGDMLNANRSAQWQDKDYSGIADITDVNTAEDNAKAYADSLVVGLWDDRGNYDASSGAYPSSGGSGTAGAILKGDIWTISVAGTLPTGQVVEIGDTVRAKVNTPSNTQANWAIQQNNIGYTAENSANKENTTLDTSTTKYPTNKLVYDNLALKADKSLGAYKMRANNTNATANGTEQVFKAIDQQSYGGTITFTAGTAPSGTLSSAYSWMQIGNMVTLTLSATYANAGATVTQCVIPLPTDMPNPIKPTGRTAASEKLYSAVGAMMATTTGTTASAFSSYLRANSANTGFEFVITMSSGSYKVIDLTCTYPVS